MIRIVTIEFTKYVRAFVIILILYVLLMTILVSRVEAKNFFNYGAFDFQTFKVLNSSFATLIASVIPLTIILNICNEFRNGYALKLISNGLSRPSYCLFKFVLAGTLAVMAMLLYVLAILILISIQKTNYFDRTIFLSSLTLVLVYSMFCSTIAVSLAILFRTWQYALLAYYGYGVIETIVAFRFEENTQWVKYLPFKLAGSIFQLQAVPEKFTDYFVAAGIIIPFCLSIVWCAYHFFKKADL